MNKGNVATNNAHIPDDLMTALRMAARAGGRSADALLAEAARRYLDHKELDALVERGRSYARRLGRKPSDVARLIEETRARRRGR
jgi:hypothetical protein